MVNIREAADESDILPLRHQISDEKFNEYSPNARLRIMKRTREYEDNMGRDRESDAASSAKEDKKLTRKIKRNEDFLRPDRDHYSALPQTSKDIDAQRARALEDWEKNKSSGSKATPASPSSAKRPAKKKPSGKPLGLGQGQGQGSRITYTKPKSVITDSTPKTTTVPAKEHIPGLKQKTPQKNITNEEIEKMWDDPASWGSDFPKELFDDEQKECMNVINGDNCGKPSEHLLNLTGDLPPLELCKDCVGNLMILNKDFKAPKSIKSNIYNNLIRISNKLDQSGFYKEADIIDLIIKSNL